MTVTYPSNIKVLHYNFSPEEVYALYRLVRYHIGYMPIEDKELMFAIDHLCSLIDPENELATKHHKTA
jgi:hypothetical protein